MNTTEAGELPRYRVVEDADAPGAFDVMDTRTASGRWRRIETHCGRADAERAAEWWNNRSAS